MHLKQSELYLLASYGVAHRPAGNTIPQFRYNPETDRMEQIGMTAPVGDGRVTPTAYNGLGAPGAASPVSVRPAGVLWPAFWGLLSTASLAASAYHGVKRNDSVGWGVWWGAMGALFPVITPAIAIAQGFGKRARD